MFKPAGVRDLNLSRPAPLIPSDVSLRGFDFFPVYRERLRDSVAWARCRAQHVLFWPMFNLWQTSWFAVPAGSIENDEGVIAGAAECTLESWRKYREQGAFHGWVLCADNRWYHPTVCAIAWEKWLDRLVLFHAKDVERTRLANKRAVAAGQREQALPRLVDYVRRAYPRSAEAIAAHFGETAETAEHKVYRLWPRLELALPTTGVGPTPLVSTVVSPLAAASGGDQHQTRRQTSASGAELVSRLKEEGKSQKNPPEKPPRAGGVGATPDEARPSLPVAESGALLDCAGFVALYAKKTGVYVALSDSIQRSWDRVSPVISASDMEARVAAYVARHKAENRKFQRDRAPMGASTFLRRRHWIAFATGGASGDGGLEAARVAGLAARTGGTANRPARFDLLWNALADAAKLARFREGWGIFATEMLKALHPRIVTLYLWDAQFLPGSPVIVRVRSASVLKHLRGHHGEAFARVFPQGANLEVRDEGAASINGLGEEVSDEQHR